MSQFGTRVDAFMGEFFRLYPVAATATGMHDYDGDWPDLSAAGRAARLAFIDRWTAELRSRADADLTPDERLDRDLLVSELAALLFDETELREEAWDPLGYVYLLGGGIFPLLARDFAPMAARLESVASRARGDTTDPAFRAARAGRDGLPAGLAIAHGDGDQAAAGDRGPGRRRNRPGRRRGRSAGRGRRSATAAGGRRKGSRGHLRLRKAGSGRTCWQSRRATAGWARSSTPASCATRSGRT